MQWMWDMLKCGMSAAREVAHGTLHLVLLYVIVHKLHASILYLHVRIQSMQKMKYYYILLKKNHCKTEMDAKSQVSTTKF